MTQPIYILGGFQTDFAEHATRSGKALIDLVGAAGRGALDDAHVAAGAVGSVHVGNFAAELFAGQGHLGGLVAEAMRALEGCPIARHEAACASGSVAIAAARAEIMAGMHDVSLVVGVELMRNVSGAVAAQHLASAAWAPNETEGVPFLWPQFFSDLGDEYDRRYGLKHAHLATLAKQMYANAKRNPLAQSRTWSFGAESFAEDDAHNPIVAGRIRRQDCSQITDGAAGLVLASERFGTSWAKERGVPLDTVPHIIGFGHRTARMSFAGKLADSQNSDYVFPHVHGTFTDALASARLKSWRDIDTAEVHDCFTTTLYMLVEHLGITAPGEAWRAIEDGVIAPGGALPINPSGGLIGLGHPVGASGVRMVWDAARQVSGRAGDCQVEGARRAATLNIGGSATTSVSFIVEAAR